jgi:hypothetical protein
VNWQVATECAAIELSALGSWCGQNPFGEHHGHGARELITNPALLSPFVPPAK